MSVEHRVGVRGILASIVSDQDDKAPRPSSDELGDLEPIRRDRGFVYRLVAALIAGAMAATFVGWKLQRAAAGCGAGLVRPGSTVIPPSGGSTP
jgi:hypothetical protein